jgi:hypothetical protein
MRSTGAQVPTYPARLPRGRCIARIHAPRADAELSSSREDEYSSLPKPVVLWQRWEPWVGAAGSFWREAVSRQLEVIAHERPVAAVTETE